VYGGSSGISTTLSIVLPTENPQHNFLLLKFLQSISLQLLHKLGCFSAQQIPQLPKLCQKKLLGFEQGLQLSSSSSSSSSSTDLVRPPICVHHQERS
jgi:hypothetical protein